MLANAILYMCPNHPLVSSPHVLLWFDKFNIFYAAIPNITSLNEARFTL